MSVASERRSARRESSRRHPSSRYRAEADASAEKVAAAAPPTVETVETVPSVIEKTTQPSAPSTVASRRARGIETPARRIARLREEAVLTATLPYGGFTTFVTDEGTVDVTKMVKELGSEKTASMLVAAGYKVTPKVVEAIAAGKDVPGMTAVDRATLAKLAGLSSFDVVAYVTGGNLGAKEAVMAEMPPDLKEWYSGNLSGVTLAAIVDRLWPAPAPRPGGRVRVGDSGLRGETLAKVEYLKGLGFSPAAVVEFIHGSDFRASEGETGHILAEIAGKTAPEGLSADLKAWYNQQIAEMEAALVVARKEVKAKVATLKASGKEYDHSDIDRIYYNVYPKWSNQYKSNKQEYARHKAYEVKIAAQKATRALRIPGAEVTEIAVGATANELATAQTDRDAGKGCPATVNTYKVVLKDGDIILVNALQSGSNLTTGRNAAIAKAEEAGYNVAWATKKMSYERVFQMDRQPTITVGLYEVENAKGKKIKIHAPLEASDNIILEMADAYHLPGNPDSFNITGRAEEQITVSRASQLLSNAESTSGRAYGIMYMTVNPAFGDDFSVSPDSVPVRTGKSNTAVTFLSPVEADTFRLTDTYKEAKGTDIQRINVAYQGYLNAPRVEMPNGWSMLVKSIKDTIGNILIYGFDALSEERREEIENEIKVAASGEEVTADEAGIGAEEEVAGEVAEVVAEEVAEPIPDMNPDPVPKAGITIPITEGELQRIARANESGQCVGTIRTYFTVKVYKVVLKDGTTILVEALSNESAEKKAIGADYEVAWVTRMMAWENPEEVTVAPETEEDATPIFSIADFESDLSDKPRFLQDAYAVGGISGYNAGVEVYNDTVRSADRVYGGDSIPIPDPHALQVIQEAYETGGLGGYNAAMAAWAASQEGLERGPSPTTILLLPDLVNRVNSPEFQQQYAAVLQPSGMTDEEYAQISSYITPKGIDKETAFSDGVPGSLFNEFVLENSSPEFRAGVESGDLILVPYGDAIKKEEFEQLPDIYQQTLLEDGFPMIQQQEEDNRVTNLAQGFRQNSWDAFYLASIGVIHDLKSAATAELAGAFKTDYEAGDLKPEVEVLAVTGSGAFIGTWVRNFGGGSANITAEEAVALNERSLAHMKEWEQLYDDMQRAQLNWEAERPLLQPIFPQGPLQSFQDDPKNILNPLVYAETIMSTLPYTLATLGVSIAGWFAGGPAGLMISAPFVFGFTFGVEGHQIYADALANGASREQARDLMNVYGSMSAAVETVGDSLFVGVLGSGAKLIYRSLGRKVASGFVRAAAKQYGWAKLTGMMVFQFANQAGQEATQQIVANAAVRTVNEERPLFEGVADAFVAGLIGTAPFILIPSAGHAIRLGRGIDAADVKGKLINPKVTPSEQQSIVTKALRPLAQLIDTALPKDSAAARRIVSLYTALGSQVMQYVSAAIEFQWIQRLMQESGISASQWAQLRERANELSGTLEQLAGPLQESVQTLIEKLSESKEVSDEIKQQLAGMPGSIVEQLSSSAEGIFEEGAALEGEPLGGRRKPRPATPRASTVDVTAARLYDAGYSIGELLRMARNLPDNVRGIAYDILYNIATSLDIALRRAAAAYSTAQIYLTQTLPRATEQAVQNAITNLEKAQNNARRAIIDAKNLFAEDLPRIIVKAVKEDIPGKATQALQIALRALDAATEAVNAAVARARVFVTKDIPSNVLSAYLKTVDQVNATIGMARGVVGVADYILTKGIPGLMAEEARAAKDAVDNAAVEALKAIAELKTEAIAKGLETIEAADRALRDTVERLGRAIAAADIYLTETLPGLTVELAAQLAGRTEAAARAVGEMTVEAAAEMRTLATEKLPAKVNQILTDAQQKVQQTVTAAREAVAEARRLVAKGMYDAAMATLHKAALTIEASRKALDRAQRLLLKTIPEAVYAQLQAAIEQTLTEMRNVVKLVGQSILSAEHFVVETAPKAVRAELEQAKNRVKIFVGETIPAAAGRALDASLAKVEAALEALMRVEAALKSLVLVKVPATTKAAVAATRGKVEEAISATQQALREARDLITKELPRRAAETLSNAVRLANECLSKARTILAMAEEGIIALPGKTVQAMESAVAALESSVQQAYGYLANTTRHMMTRAIEGATTLTRETQRLYSESTGKFSEGMALAISEQKKAELPVRAQQRARAAEVAAIRISEEVRAEVESEFMKMLSGVRRPYVSPAGYRDALDEVTRILGSLLAVARETEVSDDMRGATADIIKALFSGDTQRVQRAGSKLKDASQVLPSRETVKITKEVEERLRAIGVTEAEIKRITPQEAWDRLYPWQVPREARLSRSAVPTKFQYAVLHALGYTDKQIDRMTQGEAERLVGPAPETTTRQITKIEIEQLLALGLKWNEVAKMTLQQALDRLYGSQPTKRTAISREELLKKFPTTITKFQHSMLQALGHTDEQIDSMTQEEVDRLAGPAPEKGLRAITKTEIEQLLALGLKWREIEKMTPQQAWDRLYGPPLLEKTTREEYLRKFPTVVTEFQHSLLKAIGYTDEQINEMTQGEVDRLAGPAPKVETRQITRAEIAQLLALGLKWSEIEKMTSRQALDRLYGPQPLEGMTREAYLKKFPVVITEPQRAMLQSLGYTSKQIDSMVQSEVDKLAGPAPERGRTLTKTEMALLQALGLAPKEIREMTLRQALDRLYSPPPATPITRKEYLKAFPTTITKHQRAILQVLGYTDTQIDNMTQGEVDRLAGPTLERGQRALTRLEISMLLALGLKWAQIEKMSLEEALEQLYKTPVAGITREELRKRKLKGRREVPLPMRTVQRMAKDGGEYIAEHARDLTILANYRLVLYNLLKLEKWGDVKVQLEDFVNLMKQDAELSSSSEAIQEVEDILEGNEDRSPGDPPPSGLDDLKPPERRTPSGGGLAVATAVKEEVATEVATEEEVAAEEKEAVEEAEQEKEGVEAEEKEEELTEEEREALEKARQERLSEIAEEAAAKEAAERATRMARPGLGPTTDAVTRVVSKQAIQLEPEAEIEEMPPIEPAKMPVIEPGVLPAVETEIAVIPAIVPEVAVAPVAETVLAPKIREETQLLLEPAQAEERPQPVLQEVLQAVVQERMEQPPVTQTQVQTQVQQQPPTGIKTAVTMPPWWLLPPIDAVKEAYRRRIPILIWRMGALKSGEIWKAVIAPQKQVNLLTVIGTSNLPVPPKRYATGPGSAAKTLQWLGHGPRYGGAADIGIVDVFWDRKGANLRFGGKGLKTNVGTRMPTPTKGIAIEVKGGGVGAKAGRKTGTLSRGRIVAASPAGTPVPAGSLAWAWAAGTVGRGISRVHRVRWYYLPPPYTGESIPLPGPPHGATNPEGTSPLETVQIIGRSRKATPTARIDLGFAEIRTARGKLEEVIPKQQVATALEQEIRATQETILEPDEESVLEPRTGKTRVGLSKKAPKRKPILTEWDRITTLKGFDPYTLEGL